MGVQPFLTAATLLGVLAQRLVRQLCPHCKVSTSVNLQQWQYLTEGYEIDTPVEMFQPVGCEHCRQTGYKGRIGIYELMPIDLTLKQWLSHTDDLGELKTQLKQQGFEPLRIAGAKKVLQGVTSLEEVLRVVPLS